MPPQLGLPLQALEHSVVHVHDTHLGGIDDGTLIRRLAEADCDWLLTLDLHRQAETWPPIYTALAEEDGRMLRLRPAIRRDNRGPLYVAQLTTYLVTAYRDWSPWLDVPEIRLIDIGRGVTTSVSRTRVPTRGPRAYSAYTRQEVAGLMQQQLGYGPGPRVHERQRTRRGRARD